MLLIASRFISPKPCRPDLPELKKTDNLFTFKRFRLYRALQNTTNKSHYKQFQTGTSLSNYINLQIKSMYSINIKYFYNI